MNEALNVRMIQSTEAATLGVITHHGNGAHIHPEQWGNLQARPATGVLRQATECSAFIKLKMVINITQILIYNKFPELFLPGSDFGSAQSLLVSLPKGLILYPKE